MTSARTLPRGIAATAALGVTVLGLTAVGASGAQATPPCATTVAGLNTDISQAGNTAVTLCLGGDIIEASSGNADTSLTLVNGSNITLQLNGHTLSITSPALSAAAIEVPVGATLTINDTGGGSIVASGGDGSSSSNYYPGAGAGIGGDGGNGGNGVSAGTVVINGGTVTATGGGATQGAAGIGGGGSSINLTGGSGGTVTINGGTVTATGGPEAAGIGGGTGNLSGAGGAVTISGGTVTATSGRYLSFAGAAIGAGLGGSPVGTLTLDGTCSSSGGNTCPPTTAGNGYSNSSAEQTGAAISVTGSSAATFTQAIAQDATASAAAEVRFIFQSAVVTQSPSPTPSPTPATPSPTPATPSLAVSTVTLGGSTTVTDSGFNPGESVAVYLHSTPALLTTVTANSSGAISATVTIPPTTAVGSHQIELRGAQSGSFLSAAFTVTAAKVNSGGVEAPSRSASWVWAALVALGGTLLLGSGIALGRIRAKG